MSNRLVNHAGMQILLNILKIMWAIIGALIFSLITNLDCSHFAFARISADN